MPVLCVSMTNSRAAGGGSQTSRLFGAFPLLRLTVRPRGSCSHARRTQLDGSAVRDASDGAFNCAGACRPGRGSSRPALRLFPITPPPFSRITHHYLGVVSSLVACCDAFNGLIWSPSPGGGLIFLPSAGSSVLMTPSQRWENPGRFRKGCENGALIPSVSLNC